MSEFVAEAFTNEFGQVIKPGDPVVFAGYSGYVGTRMNRGIFKGVRYANVTRTHYLKDESGNYIKEEHVNAYNGSTYLVNKTERITTREPVAVTVEQVPNGHKYAYVDGKYQKTDEMSYRTSTLPKMRVYKLDTSMQDLVGKRF